MTYAERLAAMRDLSDEDLVMIAVASERTIAEDRGRGFETVTEVRQRLEAARELLDGSDPPCPFCENLDSQHGSQGECPDIVDDWRGGT